MKENKGITLIALIITVVIMLILAGVVISGIIEDEGLFSKTRQTTGLYEYASRGENEILEYLNNTIDEYTTTKYIDYSISDDGLLKVIDEDGNLYVSEQKINIGESQYTNTGVGLLKIDNIRASRFIYSSDYSIEYIMDNTGKMYFFNEELNKCELLANGKEFYGDCFAFINQEEQCILAKDGYVYTITGNNVELREEVKDIKFKEIKYGRGLSIDNKLYNLDYGTLLSADYKVIDFGYDGFIDENNDVYKTGGNSIAPKRKSDGEIKFEKFYDYNGEYIIAENGYLYRERRSSVELIVPVDYKNIKYFENEDTVILNTGYFYNNAAINEILESMNIKINRIIEDSGAFIFTDENNDLYFLSDWYGEIELTCTKINDNIKIKEILTNRIDALYCLGVDNKVYTVSVPETPNETPKLTLCSDDKITYNINSPFHQWLGVFGITKNGEICYSLRFLEIN